jgi:hypothetical protein
MKFLCKPILSLIGLAFLFDSCGEGARSGYRIEDGVVVLYIGFPAQKSVVDTADANSFTAIDKLYGKDNQHVFYRGQIISNADPASFTYLAGPYAKDNRNGYFQEKIISTDAAHFAIVPNPDETATNVTAEGIAYAHDSHHVYKGTLVLPEADATTFAFVPMFNGNFLTRDVRHVYANDKALTHVDGQSFQRISALNFKDSHMAWGLSPGRETRWLPIPDADLSTFAGIGKYYARDRNRVYFGNEVIPNANPATFEETGYLTAKDKKQSYQSGNIAAN